MNQNNFTFFENYSNINKFERVINSFRATLDVSIFITGSNGKLLSGELATLLSGRYVIDREFDAFKAISDNYPKYVISMDKADFSRDGILHKNVIKFLVKDVGV